MSQIAALARKDLRVIYRDRFLVMLVFYALLLALVARFGVPRVPVENLGIYIAPAITLFGPLFLGTVLGFALIEEREQGTWLLLRVLPLGEVGLFTYLAATATILSWLTGLTTALLYGYPVADWTLFHLVLASASVTAPLVMLILGALASNKVEGLALNKIISVVGLVPALVFVVPMPWQWLLAWCPWYWVYLGFLEAYSGDTSTLDAVYWPDFPPVALWVIPLLLSLAAMRPLARLYVRRAQ